MNYSKEEDFFLAYESKLMKFKLKNHMQGILEGTEPAALAFI